MLSELLDENTAVEYFTKNFNMEDTDENFLVDDMTTDDYIFLT